MSWREAIPYPHFNPVFFELGPLQFRWYGLMYLIGLTAAYLLITRKVREKGLAISKDQIYDMVVWAALGVFIGGRLGYTLFYNFSYYVQHPMKFFAVWDCWEPSCRSSGSAGVRGFPSIRSPTLPPP
jgi:phosphatidylglycerol---prolipoprotein diacylglyceryl transferase